MKAQFKLDQDFLPKEQRLASNQLIDRLKNEFEKQLIDEGAQILDNEISKNMNQTLRSRTGRNYRSGTVGVGQRDSWTRGWTGQGMSRWNRGIASPKPSSSKLVVVYDWLDRKRALIDLFPPVS